mmetsp:Transcript_125324/g.360023  ORF Transcript_125324/g.360023 Transcript_125324/m.360023 type:complete len:487 (-) Transcript_125324:45-1505(-)
MALQVLALQQPLLIFCRRPQFCHDRPLDADGYQAHTRILRMGENGLVLIVSAVDFGILAVNRFVVGGALIDAGVGRRLLLQHRSWRRPARLRCGLPRLLRLCSRAWLIWLCHWLLHGQRHWRLQRLHIIRQPPQLLLRLVMPTPQFVDASLQLLQVLLAIPDAGEHFRHSRVELRRLACHLGLQIVELSAECGHLGLAVLCLVLEMLRGAVHFFTNFLELQFRVFHNHLVDFARALLEPVFDVDPESFEVLGVLAAHICQPTRRRWRPDIWLRGMNSNCGAPHAAPIQFFLDLVLHELFQLVPKAPPLERLAEYFVRIVEKSFFEGAAEHRTDLGRIGEVNHSLWRLFIPVRRLNPDNVQRALALVVRFGQGLPRVLLRLVLPFRRLVVERVGARICCEELRAIEGAGSSSPHHCIMVGAVQIPVWKHSCFAGRARRQRDGVPRIALGPHFYASSHIPLVYDKEVAAPRELGLHAKGHCTPAGTGP